MAAYAEQMAKKVAFQSYQFRQINPDLDTLPIECLFDSSFNRINSGRSIPTIIHNSNLLSKTIRFQSYQFRQINPDYDASDYAHVEHTMFQSYQFRQINPDPVFVPSKANFSKRGFNRINSGRSIPTTQLT